MKPQLLLGVLLLGHSLLVGCDGSDSVSPQGNAGGSGGGNPSGIGGNHTGGASATGGLRALGGAHVGGATSGGVSSGGAATGGVAVGGQSMAGASSLGGAPNGGASGSAPGGSTSGGSNIGGAANGGASNGGKSAGGANTAGAGRGGASTGGSASGGTATGGAASGGRTTGGSAAGGRSTGGNAAGGSAAGGSNVDPHGFTLRLPTSRQVTCAGSVHTLEDSDWICTFNYGATKGFVYIQSTPVDCVQVMSVVPSFTSVAQLSINGQVTSLGSASYDWGGNHHNDMLSFTYGGNGYDYYHSSFGFGWRSCNDMDCLQVSVGATGTVTNDGCTSTRTLPQVCSQIATNGTYADLAVDKFAKCPGDTS